MNVLEVQSQKQPKSKPEFEPKLPFSWITRIIFPIWEVYYIGSRKDRTKITRIKEDLTSDTKDRLTTVTAAHQLGSFQSSFSPQIIFFKATS